MNQGDTFDALYELADGIVSKYSAGVSPDSGAVKANMPQASTAPKSVEYPPNAVTPLSVAEVTTPRDAVVVAGSSKPGESLGGKSLNSPASTPQVSERSAGQTAVPLADEGSDVIVIRAAPIVSTLGTCDHIDIWGETGVDGIACKSPAIKQCEGCGESMCKAHLVENTCRECAGKL